MTSGSIAIIDGVAALCFLSAAALALAVARVTLNRTRIWPYIAAVYALFFVDRLLNAVEWGLENSRLLMVEKFEDFLAMAACVILLVLARQFLALIRTRPQTET